jgi:hypothetical protein
MRVPQWAWVLLLIGGLAASVARAEEFVVIDASGSDKPIGTVFASGAVVTVPDHGRLVLLGASGQVVSLTGPFEGVPSAKPAGSANNRVFAAIASLVHTDQKETTPGAVRSTEDPAIARIKWRIDSAKTLTDVLAIDTSNGGETCLYDLTSVRLIRKPSSRPSKVTIHDRNGGALAAIPWPQDAASLPWPAQVPIADGASYLIELEGQAALVKTTIHLLSESSSATSVERVAQLADRGCKDQGRLLLVLLARASK